MSRIGYVLQRAVLTIFSIFIIASGLFFMFRLIPGDPSTVFVNPAMPAGTRERILEAHGLNKPLHEQYIIFLGNLIQGELGLSFMRQKPVTELLLAKALNTMLLFLPSVLIAFIIGPIVGAFLAWHRGSRIDTIGMGTILLMYAAPVFWTGMIAIMIFSFWLGWVPSGKMHSASFTADSLLDSYLSVDFLYHLVLPMTVTTLYWLTAPMFTMRNNMIDVLGADFIEMNRAQGLSELRILYMHGARNSLLPVLHYGALAVGFAFGSSVILERVFSWPGLGRFMFTAVRSSDYPVAQGAFLFISIIIIVMNFLIDVLSVYVDPRVSEEA